MIISDKYKYIFISTQKTGSQSFFKFLPEHFNGVRNNVGGHHSTQIPKNIDINEYTIFSTCKNPYERAFSIWFVLMNNKPYKVEWLKILKDDTFLTFCKFISEHGNSPLPVKRAPSVAIPQYIWYTYLPEKTIPLHIENIDEEFNKLPFVDKKVKIPRINKKGTELTFKDAASDEIVHYLNIWANEDFEKFGYERL